MNLPNLEKHVLAAAEQQALALASKANPVLQDEARQAFARDCEQVFKTSAGQRIITALCAAAHPLDHSPLPSEIALVDRGRKEVVALLWRYGWAANNTHPPIER